MTATDTIFALSTGHGRAALAVIRLSGPATASTLAAISGRLPEPRRLVLRSIRNPDSGEILDRCLVAWLPAPHSFSGEDCAELHLHGSPAVVSAVVAVLGHRPGVRPAEPGEFTRRAFLNGRLDLVEVEGLADLLDARTSHQRRQAMRQASGFASGVFEAWRQKLLLVRADIEAVVDFIDEEGVAEVARPAIDARISGLIGELTTALDQSAKAEIVRDGVRIVLAGLPNTGKSSLLNALARRDAAIVSDVPGTTRDVIEVWLDVEGIPVLLTDTAGLRSDAVDKVEMEGIRRTKAQISGADLVLWLWSSDIAGSEEPSDVKPDLVIHNKIDLDSGLLRNESRSAHLQVSTLTGEGIPMLLKEIAGLLKVRLGPEEPAVLVSERQQSVVRNSIRFLNEALAVPSEHLELKAEHVRRASDEIGRLTGKLGVEEWLGAIFSRFCIGK